MKLNPDLLRIFRLIEWLRKIFRLGITALLLLLPNFVFGQWVSSKLPYCPSSGLKNNCLGTYIDKTGQRYSGEWKNGRFHGNGFLIDPSGERYAGTWLEGKRNGRGTQIFPDGSKYVGEFQSDRRQGIGTFIFPNGSRYVGFWDNDKRGGEGILYGKEGNVIKSGRWADSELLSSQSFPAERFPSGIISPSSSGQKPLSKDIASQKRPLKCPPTGVKDNCIGEQTQLDGSRYVGQFKSNLWHGQGALSLANGDLYIGEFFNSKYHGQGTYQFADKVKYVGEFFEGKRHGTGVLTESDGTKYEGEWREDRRSGRGTLTKSDGTKYVGEWLEGLRSGHGTLTFNNGESYRGEFLKGSPNGIGTYTFRSGDRHVGTWLNGERSGKGIEYRVDGSINKSGEWVDGRFVNSEVVDSKLFPLTDLIKVTVGDSTSSDVGLAERQRLAAELEEERIRRQAIESRLAIEQTERERISGVLQEQELKKQAALAEVERQKAIIKSEKRIALIIGNSRYLSNPLLNPVNDAIDIGRTLDNLGFKTMVLTDASITQMREATRNFADAVPQSDVALIFYAGHGLEVKGRNYLVPVNATIRHEFELEDQAYDAGRWLDMLENNKAAGKQRVNILILDACRDNVFSRGWRSSSRGLARMDAPTGTFIAFATAPGKVASDGDRQRNSPFTKNLLQTIQIPNMPIELMFREVRRRVLEETKGEQVPWDNSSLIGNFVFNVSR